MGAATAGGRRGERLVLDTSVLVPRDLRRLLLTLADLGAFTPVISPGIVGEWRHRTCLDGAAALAEMEAVHARLLARWPGAEIMPREEDLRVLSLPDPADVHVLAAALAAGAAGILTANLRDFPTRTLARHGLLRHAPDPWLASVLAEDPARMAAALDAVFALRGAALPARLRRLGLRRLARALQTGGGAGSGNEGSAQKSRQ